jgi:cytochrome c biogenesis protein CcdA
MSGDPASGVGVLTALAAGIVSFLSPCVLPLVPGYLSAVTGVAAADLERADWRRVIVPSLLFVSSFSAIFILLGLGATRIGSTLQEHQLLLDKIAASLIIAMGVFFISALFLPQLNREWHVEGLLERAGTGGPLVAGAAFGLAWTPCIGPTLAAILSAAAVSGSAAHGAFLLADDRLRGRQAPLPRDHGDRRPDPDRLRRRDPDRLVRHLQSLGAGPAQQPRDQLVRGGLSLTGWLASRIRLTPLP